MHESGGAPYRVLRPGRALVDHGPMTLTVDASAGGQPLTPATVAGAERALAALTELVPFLPLARREVASLGPLPAEAPEVLRRMVAAVALLGEGDFTPMAAVAGTFAEVAMEAALAAGATRVIVNNGGDIALEAPAGERVRVGMVSDLAVRRVTHSLDVTGGSGIGGVATSGFGGRSLTKGIASAAVALAATAAAADALATALANATNADDPAVRRCRAEELDPGTDIRGHIVTAAVGEVPADVRRQALATGRRRAEELRRQGVLSAWAIFVGDEMACWPDGLVHELPNQVEV